MLSKIFSAKLINLGVASKPDVGAVITFNIIIPNIVYIVNVD